MINQLSALFFPDTAPDPKILARLLLFFETITLYQPCETGTPPDWPADLGQPAIQASCPVPLGPDLELFNRQLHNLTHRHDTPGELDSLALAALSNDLRGDRDELTSSSLLTAILKQEGDTAPDHRTAELWQARLTLKLAEKLDQEEREINQGLAAISGQESQLFKVLKGAGDDETEDLLAPGPATPLLFAKPEAHRRPLVRKQVTAWSRLYLEDESPNRPALLVSANRQAAGLLFDAYESLTQKEPSPLFSLPLAPLAESVPEDWQDQEFVAKRTAFRQQAAPLLQKFTELLGKAGSSQPPPAGLDQPLPRIYDKEVEAWTQETKGPRSEPLTLTLYSLPGVGADRLLCKAGGLDPQKHRARVSPPGDRTLVALLTSG